MITAFETHSTEFGIFYLVSWSKFDTVCTYKTFGLVIQSDRIILSSEKVEVHTLNFKLAYMPDNR